MAGTARILTLVRHAKSDWAGPARSDLERPLNARGERDAPAMARRALAAGLRPTLIISSPAARALATARTFAQVFGYPERRILQSAGVYEATAGQLLELVRAHGGRARHVMLFGHNPGLSDFAARLADEPALAGQPTCALVSLAIDAPTWSELQWGAGRVRQHDWPKKSR